MNFARSRWRWIGIALITGLLTLGLAGSVAAHETREVGDYEFVVGFMNEPAYVNELNGIDLRISHLDGEGHDHNGHSNGESHGHDDHDDSEDHHHNGGAPVENAHETLQAAILYGEEVKEVELRPVWGNPGVYTADVVPTSTGTYSFRFVGEINGQEVDETFRGGPNTFSEVEDRSELEFPADPATPADDDDQMMAIGIAGVVAGLLGMVAGAAGWYKASNAPNSRPVGQEAARQRKAAQRQQQQQERSDE